MHIQQPHHEVLHSQIVAYITVFDHNIFCSFFCSFSFYVSPADANLCGIQMIAQTWGVVPGLSDHTIGPVVPIVATILLLINL